MLAERVSFQRKAGGNFKLSNFRACGRATDLPARISPGHARAGQRFREAKLMSVRIMNMKESFAPWCVPRHLRFQTFRKKTRVVRISVVHSKNHPAPPAARIAGRSHEVHVRVAGPKSCKSRRAVAINRGKSELFIELDRTDHILNRERPCADMLDHPSWASPSSLFLARRHFLDQRRCCLRVCLSLTTQDSGVSFADHLCDQEAHVDSRIRNRLGDCMP
jgi:hypothetical protein